MLHETIDELQRSLSVERNRSDFMRQSVIDARDLLYNSDLSTSELRRAAALLGNASEDQQRRRRRRAIPEAVAIPTASSFKLALNFRVDADNTDQIDELMGLAAAASGSDVSWERSGSSIRLTFDPMPPQKEVDAFRAGAEDLGFVLLDNEVRA
jgi:hypothetical protein